MKGFDLISLSCYESCITILHLGLHLHKLSCWSSVTRHIYYYWCSAPSSSGLLDILYGFFFTRHMKLSCIAQLLLFSWVTQLLLTLQSSAHIGLPMSLGTYRLRVSLSTYRLPVSLGTYYILIYSTLFVTWNVLEFCLGFHYILSMYGEHG